MLDDLVFAVEVEVHAILESDADYVRLAPHDQIQIIIVEQARGLEDFDGFSANGEAVGSLDSASQLRIVFEPQRNRLRSQVFFGKSE